jgi:hypothetical protein
MAGRCWRVVEAQHTISTLKLVDTLAEQHLLEQLLEDSKPPIPADCRHLHYLLATPFRYGAAYPSGSRFRRAGLTPGVFYASATPDAAVAEMAFRRLLFFAESPDTPWPSNAGEYTAFETRFRTRAGLDLTMPPLDRDAARWTHSTDYAPCQALADAARKAAVQVLRYHSARSPGRNVALFSCAAFGSREPLQRQTWRLHLGGSGARAICEYPAQRLEFERAAFAADPRIAAIRWER